MQGERNTSLQNLMISGSVTVGNNGKVQNYQGDIGPVDLPPPPLKSAPILAPEKKRNSSPNMVTNPPVSSSPPVNQNPPDVTYRANCNACQTELQFTTRNPTGEYISVDCPVCKGSTLVHLQPNGHQAVPVSAYPFPYTPNQASPDQANPYPAYPNGSPVVALPPHLAHHNPNPNPNPYPYPYPYPYPPNQNGYPPMQYPPAANPHAYPSQQQHVHIVNHNHMSYPPPPQLVLNIPYRMETDRHWEGGIAPGWYFVKGSWSSDAKETFDGVSFRMEFLQNGTIGGIVLQRKDYPLPQFLNSHLTGLWNGKNNGDLQVKVQQGQTAQITMDGKWKKLHWSGTYFQVSPTFKDAAKQHRGKFDYELVRLIA